MNLTIQLSGELEAALKAQAAAKGVSTDSYATQIVHQALAAKNRPEKSIKLQTGRGILAEYGPAPTEEEIDASRAEMLRGIAEKL